MFALRLLLTVISVAFGVSASPRPPNLSRSSSALTIPVRKSVNITSGHNLVNSGRARAQNFRDRTAGRLKPAAKRQSVPVMNEAITYVAEVAVGADNQMFKLLLDSGSANTWVGADTTYIPSNASSQSTDDIVIVEYGSGLFFGFEYYDTVKLSNDLLILNQSIGVATFSEGFTASDGILGIGPVALTQGTVLGGVAPVDDVPTITNNLLSQGSISTEMVGVSFAPATSDSDPNGELSFGAIDTTKFTGSMAFTTKETSYWGVSQSIRYKEATIMADAIGVVDTGTTLLYLPTDTFNAYISATGGVFDQGTGMYTITSAQYDALEDLVFNINGTDFALTPNAQIWPRNLNAEIGGTEDSIYLVVASTEPTADLNFINGYVFLERFYSVFDTTNSRVGFATTAFTNATTN